MSNTPRFEVNQRVVFEDINEAKSPMPSYDPAIAAALRRALIAGTVRPIERVGTISAVEEVAGTITSVTVEYADGTQVIKGEDLNYLTISRPKANV